MPLVSTPVVTAPLHRRKIFVTPHLHPPSISAKTNPTVGATLVVALPPARAPHAGNVILARGNPCGCPRIPVGAHSSAPSRAPCAECRGNPCGCPPCGCPSPQKNNRPSHRPNRPPRSGYKRTYPAATPRRDAHPCALLCRTPLLLLAEKLARKHHPENKESDKSSGGGDG